MYILTRKRKIINSKSNIFEKGGKDIKNGVGMESNEEYLELVKRHTPKSKVISHAVAAFVGGGAICAVAEGVSQLLLYLGVAERDAYLWVTLIFIFIGSLLTALGVFDKIANIIYSGALVPVTGFSNAVSSAATDAGCEGKISGVGTKIFSVSGPVILFAALSGTLYGFVYFLVGLLK